jgi:hypothetical protein
MRRQAEKDQSPADEEEPVGRGNGTLPSADEGRLKPGQDVDHGREPQADRES